MKTGQVVNGLAYALMYGALCGCYAYRPASIAALAPGAHVRAQFSPPRDLFMTRQGVESDSMLIPGVHVLEGPVWAAGGDTLTLRPVVVRWGSDDPLPARKMTARIHLATTSSVSVRRLDWGRTAIAAVAVPAALIVAFVLAWSQTDLAP